MSSAISKKKACGINLSNAIRAKKITLNYAIADAPRGVRKHYRQIALRRDDHRCQVCGGTKRLDVHHIVPRCEGGSDHENNLVTLCRSCHRAVQSGDVEKAIRTCVANAMAECKTEGYIPLSDLPDREMGRDAQPDALIPIDYDPTQRKWRWGKPPKHILRRARARAKTKVAAKKRTRRSRRPALTHALVEQCKEENRLKREAKKKEVQP